MTFKLSAGVDTQWIDWVDNTTYSGEIDLPPTGDQIVLPPYPELILQSSPVVYLQLDETMSNTAIDISGNGLHGAYVGGVYRNGTNLVNDTTGSAYIYQTDTITLSTDPSPEKPIKGIELWVKPVALGDSIILTHYEDDNNYVRLSFIGDRFQLIKRVSGVSTTVITSFDYNPVSITSGQREDIFHIFLQVEDGRTYMYVNSTKQPQSAAGDLLNLISEFNFVIGDSTSGNTSEFYIDEFVIYDEIVSSVILGSHYKAGDTTRDIVTQYIKGLEPTLFFDFRGYKSHVNQGSLGDPSNAFALTLTYPMPPRLVMEDGRPVFKGIQRGGSNIASHEVFGSGTSYTLMAYFRKPTTGYSAIAGIRAGYPNESVIFNNIWNSGSGGNTINVEHFLEDGSNAGTVSFVGYDTNEWYFMVMVRDYNTNYLYVNGILVDTATVPKPDLAVKNQVSSWQIFRDGGYDEDNGLTSFNAAFDYAVAPETIIELNSMVHGVTPKSGVQSSAKKGGTQVIGTDGNVIRSEDFGQSVDVFTIGASFISTEGFPSDDISIVGSRASFIGTEGFPIGDTKIVGVTPE